MNIQCDQVIGALPVMTSGAANPLASFARRGSRVLFALSNDERPILSLERTAALASALDAELHVVRVLSRRTHVSMLFSHTGSHAVSAASEMRAAELDTRAWLGEVVGKVVAQQRLRVRTGDFVDQVSARAKAIEATLIAMAPGRGRFGADVTALSDAADLPVLVAQKPGVGDAIVAATDLEDSEYPVLRKGAELSHLLRARLIAIHNIAPLTTLISSAHEWPVVEMPPDLTDTCLEQLASARKRLHIEAEAIVAHEANAVEAILQAARARDVDLIVVGTRPHSWLARLVSGRVAARVVNRAQRSVLVTPLAGYEPAEAAFALIREPEPALAASS